MKSKHIQFAAHRFSDLRKATFPVNDYSRLKFGCDTAARKFGYELADKFAQNHLQDIISDQIVVIPAPYNYVKNASTILTHHFLNRLNSISVANGGKHVDYSVVNRKTTYIEDYAALSQEQRKGMIDNDAFYINKDFFKGKTLVWVDDVIITGTHEDKVKEVLAAQGLKNKCFFVYLTKYNGTDAAIESRLNLCYVKKLENFSKILRKQENHVTVRTLKYILTETEENAKFLLKGLNRKKISEIYHGCLGKGYYKVANYEKNFKIISDLMTEKA